MNNAKMWLVVKPTVGIPMFLTAVAVGSFAVHVAVLTNTSWVSDFLKGQPMGTGDQTAAAVLPQAETDTAKASYAPAPGDGQAIKVILPDGTVAHAVIQTDVMASADTPPPLLKSD